MASTTAKLSGVSSVLRWFGGKFYQAEMIISLMPEHHTYVEPFGGGAHVLAQKSPNISPVEIYNDIDQSVVNFLCVLTDPNLKGELIERLQMLPTSRVLFERWVKEPLPEDQMESAVRFFYILRQSIVPANNEKSGWRHGRVKSCAVDYQNAVERLEPFAKRMMRVNLECLDFREVIRKYDSESTFFFVDSPYHLRERHYKGQFSERDHAELADMLSQIKGKCLVSHYRTLFIDSLYKNWNQLEVAGNVVGNYVTSGSRRRETECYFTNYSLTQELTFF